MIVYILIGSVLSMLITWFQIRPRRLRILLGTISTFLVLSSMIVLSANLATHWGMEKRTIRTTSTKIYSASNHDFPLNILIYKRIGEKADNYILIFRNGLTDQQPTPHFVPRERSVGLISKERANYRLTSGTQAVVRAVKQEWIFKSSGYRWLFDFDNRNHQLIGQTTTAFIPKKSWCALSVKQAKRLNEIQAMKTPEQAATRQRIAEVIRAKVQEFMRRHPTATSAEIKAYRTKVRTILMADAMRQIIKNVLV